MSPRNWENIETGNWKLDSPVSISLPFHPVDTVGGLLAIQHFLTLAGA